MKEELKMIPDLSDLTCTNLMIRLKILLKKAPEDSAVECIVRRDQRDTIEVPFSRTGYNVIVHNIGNNRFQVSLKKKGERQEH